MHREHLQITDPEVARARHRLEKLRVALLDLHKALVDSERVEYERTMGKIQSPTHFLRLLTDDPWFAWLSPFSRLIVIIEESLESEEPVTRGRVDALVDKSEELLVASEEGGGFPKHYFDALQRDPNVVMALSEVAKVEGWRKPKR